MSEPFAAQDALLFLEKSPAAFALYEGFAQKLLAAFPDTRVRVQKTQITFSNRHGFGCVSQLRVRKKAELPDPYIVVTLGLPAPHPGRWTVHIVLGAPGEVDDELPGWVRQAYEFAQGN